jgi:hypothetical protein
MENCGVDHICWQLPWDKPTRKSGMEVYVNVSVSSRCVSLGHIGTSQLSCPYATIKVLYKRSKTSTSHGSSTSSAQFYARAFGTGEPCQLQ